MNLSCKDCRTELHLDRITHYSEWTNGTNLTASPKAEVFVQQTWWMLSILTLIIVITVLANLLVIVVPFINKALRTPFNFLLVNIAVGDGLIGAFDMPQYVASYIYFGFWPYSDRQCTFWLLIDYLMPSVTLSSMAVLSFDRLWAVTYPTRYRIYNTARKAVVYITSTWAFSLVAVLPGFIYARVHFGDQAINKTCQWDVEGIPVWASSFCSLVFIVWLPFLVTLVCYVGTVVKLKKARVSRSRAISIGPVLESTRRIIRRTERERQAFCVLTFLVFSMFVSWGPWVAYTIRLNLLKYEDPITFYYVAADLIYALSAVSPFMCFLGSRDMMAALKRMVGWSRNSRRLELPSISKKTMSKTRRVTAMQDTY